MWCFIVNPQAPPTIRIGSDYLNGSARGLRITSANAPKWSIQSDLGTQYRRLNPPGTVVRTPGRRSLSPASWR